MSKQKLALQTLKSIEATSRTRSAFKFSRVRNLAKLIGGLGFAFLLNDLSPVAAQTLALTERKGTQGTFSPSVRETPAHPVTRELRGITGETYTHKSGEVSPVWLAPDGRKFVYRPNGRKFFPKSINR